VVVQNVLDTGFYWLRNNEGSGEHTALCPGNCASYAFHNGGLFEEA
jgi:hypothetical protein